MRCLARHCCLGLFSKTKRASNADAPRQTSGCNTRRLCDIQGKSCPEAIVVQPDQTFVLDKARDLRYLVESSLSAIDVGYSPPSDSPLATVVLLPDTSQFSVTQAFLESTFEQYLKNDDVWQPDFLQGLVIGVRETHQASLSEDVEAWLEEQGTRWTKFISADVSTANARPGPYVYVDGALRSVARLYKDTYKTFMVAVHPAHQKKFVELEKSERDDSIIDVAVPSRLRLRRSIKAPLDGIRVAVKDSFHLFGTSTSISNRSYLETYGKRQTTASCVETLVDRGCIVVGKVKMTAFGIWQEPIDYMDYEAPWNPRGDGFQSPGGSSSGSSAASAAYEWLDIAMGADTAGSIMRPALWGGVFGLRPSFYAVSKDGMVPGIPALDTPCFLGRDLRLCRDFAAAWYGDKCRSDVQGHSFKRIIWPRDYWDIIEGTQVNIARKFASDLEQKMSLCYESVSFKNDWDAAPPIEAGDADLQEWMATAVHNLWFDDHQHFSQFREDHMKKFGTAPCVDGFVRDHWEATAKLSQAQCNEAYERVAVFKSWFKQRYINGRPDAVFVLPIEDLSPRYRDQSATQITKPPPGVNTLWLSPILGTPELIVPIDKISYHSRVTECEEFLPYAVGLMSDIGTDLALLDVAIECLQLTSRPTVVKTGKVPF